MGYKYRESIEDLVAEELAEKLGERAMWEYRYSPEELELNPTALVQSKLLKTEYCMNGAAAEKRFTTALCIMTFGMITSRQYTLTGMGDPSLLYIYAGESDKGKTTYPIKSVSAGGGSKAYVLKGSGITALLNMLPESLLDREQINTEQGEYSGTYTEHNVHVADVAYATLGERQFASFYSRMAPRYIYGVSPENNFSSQPDSPPESGTAFIPDMVLQFAERRGWCYIEQDMGTERAQKLLDKIFQYGYYFANGKSAAESTVIINAELMKSRQSVITKAVSSSGPDAYSTEVRYITDLMELEGYRTLSEVCRHLAEEAGRDSGTRSRARNIMRNKCFRLIRACGGDRGEKGLADLKEYVENFNRTNADRKKNTLDDQYRKRIQMMREVVMSAAGAGTRFTAQGKSADERKRFNDSVTAFRAAALHGLSVVPCTLDDYCKRGAYMMSYESEVTTRFIKDIVPLVDTAKMSYSYAPAYVYRQKNEKNVIKHCYTGRTPRAEDVRWCFEYYDDTAAVIRLRTFLEQMAGEKELLNIVLFVADERQAAEFYEANRIGERFCTWRNGRIPNELNTRFIFAVCGEDKPFSFDSNMIRFDFIV